MITLITKQNYTQYQDLFKKNDPQTLKINHLIKAYGVGSLYCDFYVIEQDAPIGIFCKLESEILANLYSQNAVDDLHDFVNFAGATNVMLTCEFQNPDFSAFSGDCEVIQGTIFNRQYCFCDQTGDCEIKIDDFINLVADGFEDYEKAKTDNDFYQKFYCDISHKIRHGIAKIYGQKDKWCVLRSIGNNFDILSHIAVSPKLRGQNIGTIAVNKVSDIAKKDIVIYSRNSGTDVFYTKNGFKKSGNWYIIKAKEV
ncbi:MAG: GNAT family N-acetyltransferase [Oscillospiraceae bacterium]|nr:GNAT family N-acetyltransferase [Oscillospiraceae bacterium]